MHNRQPVTPFRGQETGLCTESTMTCRSFWCLQRTEDRKKSLEKEKEMHPQNTTGSQSSFSEEKQQACALRVRGLVVSASYRGEYFRPCGDECLFPNGNREWEQYQGLSMIPTIMLPSLTGTLELDQLQELERFPWSVVSHTDNSDVVFIGSLVCRVMKRHVGWLRAFTKKVFSPGSDFWTWMVSVNVSSHTPRRPHPPFCFTLF